MATLSLGKEPGVYIQEEVNTGLAITEARLKVAGLVGHSKPTLNVYNIEVTHTGETDTMDYAGTNVLEILSVSDYLNAYGSNLPQYTDYTWKAGANGNKIVWATEAKGTLSFTANPTAEETVTVGSVTYKFVSDLAAANDVLLGDSAAATAANLVAAINGAEGAGTTYGEGTVANAAATAALTVDVVTVTAVAAGASGNSVALESTSGSVDASGATLTGGGASAETPDVGATYYVSAIIKKDASYYVPRRFADANSVAAYYGPEWYVENGENKINEITLAARLMFNNGANEIYCCEAERSAEGKVDITNVENAIMLLDDIELQSIVCIYEDAEEEQAQSIQQFLAQRVVIDSATENQRERVGFICALSDDVDTIVSQSESYKEQRIVNVAPSKCTVLATDAAGTAQEFEVSTNFAAAACVGMLVNNARPVSQPLTRQYPVGIYGVSATYTRPNIEKLSAAGVMLLKERDGSVMVNQSVTTDNTNQNNRELSVVLIKDEVMKDLRYNLDRDYIGKAYNRKTTPTKIKTSIVNILNQYLDTLIESFNEGDIVVTADPDDTTRVNVSLAFAVLRPLNYIYISFTVTL